MHVLGIEPMPSVLQTAGIYKKKILYESKMG